MKQNPIVKSFKDLGVDEVPENQGSLRELIVQVLEANKGKWFPKGAFTKTFSEVEGMAHSGAAIHNALKKLVEANTIEVSKTSSGGKKNYYRIPSSTE